MPNIDKDGQVWPETDLDLNTSPNLRECPVAEGMSPDSLSPATRAALTKGFQTDNDEDPNDSLNGDWIPPRTPSVEDPRGWPVSGFVRPEAYTKNQFKLPS